MLGPEIAMMAADLSLDRKAWIKGSINPRKYVPTKDSRESDTVNENSSVTIELAVTIDGSAPRARKK